MFTSDGKNDWLDRVSSLADIYSSSWPQRLTVLLLIASGGSLIAFGKLYGILPFLILVWANRDRFFENMSARLQRKPWLVLAPAVVVLFACLAWPLPAAFDDLLRHIASGYWARGYEDMYAYASLPPHDLYPTFDKLLFVIAQRAGPLPTMWIVQGVAWGAFVVVFLVAASRTLPRGEDAPFWVLAALLVTVSSVAMRLTLARPEVFMATWALAAAIPRSRRGGIAWASVGMLLGSGYWLAPVYFPAALILSALRWRERAVLLVFMGLVWYSIWYALTGTHPTAGLAWLSEAIRSRTVNVSENANAAILLAMPGVVLLAGLSAWAWAQSERKVGFLLLACYFLLAGQIRYVYPVAPLLALFVLSAVRNTKWSRPETWCRSLIS